MKIFKEHGTIHLRVFPNWRDFQPAVRLYGYQGTERDIRQVDGNIFKNGNYLDEFMLERFKAYDCIIAWGIGNECNCLSETNKDTASAKFLTTKPDLEVKH